MKIVAVIPARWQSTRLKEKVLADIGGKPMLQHVWERVKKAHEVDEVIVACDKEKVMKAAEAFGAKCMFTSPEHSSGTDRLSEVAGSVEADVYINVQADEPMINPLMIDQLAQVFEYEKNILMATLIKRIDKNDDIADPNVVKVVVDRKGFALYFSRSPIPYMRRDGLNTDERGIVDEGQVTGGYYKHIGLYSYTKDFLFTYRNLPRSVLEMDEKLEQLRVLEHGYKIKTIETRYDVIGVDTQEDLDKVRKIFDEEKEGTNNGDAGGKK
jgi:3-deoxy-manno-octulosonate cytidylyltransferase (CMP-KDO synthetase)